MANVVASPVPVVHSWPNVYVGRAQQGSGITGDVFRHLKRWSLPFIKTKLLPNAASLIRNIATDVDQGGSVSRSLQKRGTRLASNLIADELDTLSKRMRHQNGKGYVIGTNVQPGTVLQRGAGMYPLGAAELAQVPRVRRRKRVKRVKITQQGAGRRKRKAKRIAKKRPKCRKRRKARATNHSSQLRSAFGKSRRKHGISSMLQSL